MLSQSDLETIKETAKDFFKKATFEVEIEFLPQEDFTLPVNLNVQDPQILIGEGGQTLNEIQRLLKAILKRKIKEPFYIDLDINGYKKKKNEYLKEMARSIADEVSLTKKERVLSSMPAHERRVVHLELSERTDIITESVGQEPERKVVVKPRP
jgi:spoIIIJ-associated protein